MSFTLDSVLEFVLGFYNKALATRTPDEDEFQIIERLARKDNELRELLMKRNQSIDSFVALRRHVPHWSQDPEVAQMLVEAFVAMDIIPIEAMNEAWERVLQARKLKEDLLNR